MIKWGKELEEQFSFWQREHTSKSTAHKRSASSTSANGDGGPLKKARTVLVKKDSQGGLTDEDMREHFDRNSVEKVRPCLPSSYGEVLISGALSLRYPS